MKNKFQQSDDRFKDAFKNHETPFDEAALERFKVALDNNKGSNKRRFLPFFLLTFILIGYVLISYSVISNQTSVEKKFRTSLNHLLIDDRTEAIPTKGSLAIGTVIKSVNVSQKADIQKGTIGSASVLLKPNLDKRLKKSNVGIDKYHKGKKDNELISEVTFVPGIKNISKQNIPLNVSDSNKDKSTRFNENLLTTETQSFNQRNSLTALDKLESKVSFLENISEPLLKELSVKIEDVKYKRHFYFGVELGLSKEQNTSIYSDNPFEPHILNKNVTKPIIGLNLGYQWNGNTSFEVSYLSKMQLNKWQLQGTDFTSISKKRVHIVTPKIVNSLSILNSRLSFNSFLGLSIGYGRFSSIMSSQDDIFTDVPYEQNFRFKQKDNGSGSDFFYLASAGLGLTYQVNYNMSIGIFVNHSFGMAQISRTDVDFVIGEGVPGSFNILSKGNFSNLSFRCLYRKHHY